MGDITDLTGSVPSGDTPRPPSVGWPVCPARGPQRKEGPWSEGRLHTAGPGAAQFSFHESGARAGGQREARMAQRPLAAAALLGRGSWCVRTHRKATACRDKAGRRARAHRTQASLCGRRCSPPARLTLCTANIRPNNYEAPGEDNSCHCLPKELPR